MFKKKFFKKKPKPKEDKNQEDKDFENKETKPDVPPSIQRPKPFLPDTPVPTPPVNNISTGRILSKEAIVDLPLQHVSSNRRMEDLDDEDFGYATSDIIYTIKRKDADLEEAFLDSKTFSTYKTDGHNPTISRFFFSPQGRL
ncbi:uncharacterized protein LOC134264396 [Saccostrea cucullata]|uniref:uncharacterized protein LOC134264396 n=1 Tax=Saccostrea cuccullata TaxID=36930 RepID=UPI002ED5E7A0